MLGATAVGAGIARTSFATTLMQRYQPHAIAASVAFAIGWLIHLARTTGIHRAPLRQHSRRLANHAVVMSAAYGMTLTPVFGVSTLIENL